MKRDSRHFPREDGTGRAPHRRSLRSFRMATRTRASPGGCQSLDGPVLTHCFICSPRVREQRACDKRWLGQFVCLRQIPQPHPFSLLGHGTHCPPRASVPSHHVSVLLAALMSGVLPQFPEARLFNDPAPETMSCGGPGQPLPHCHLSL